MLASRSRAGRPSSEVGATSLPELLTVMVASLIVLGAILIGLVTMDTVSARTMSRSDALRAINTALRQVERDARGAFAVAPVDPAAPGASTDGLSFLVQQGTTTGARDPRVWVTYACRTASDKRTCTRSVHAAETGSGGCADAQCTDTTQPAMLTADGRFARGALIVESRIISDLETGSGASAVFATGWPSDASGGSCADASCTTWTRPASYADARLDPRGFYRRTATDLRPPVVRVTLQAKPGKAPQPVSASTSLIPRGCVDPAPPATTGAQFEC